MMALVPEKNKGPLTCQGFTVKSTLKNAKVCCLNMVTKVY